MIHLNREESQVALEESDLKTNLHPFHTMELCVARQQVPAFTVRFPQCYPLLTTNKGGVVMRAIYSVGLEGSQGHIVTIEARIREEKENVVIVGLPDATLKESRERVMSALHALSLDLTMTKVTI